MSCINGNLCGVGDDNTAQPGRREPESREERTTQTTTWHSYICHRWWVLVGGPVKTALFPRLACTRRGREDRGSNAKKEAFVVRVRPAVVGRNSYVHRTSVSEQPQAVKHRHAQAFLRCSFATTPLFVSIRYRTAPPNTPSRARTYPWPRCGADLVCRLGLGLFCSFFRRLLCHLPVLWSFLVNYTSYVECRLYGMMIYRTFFCYRVLTVLRSSLLRIQARSRHTLPLRRPPIARSSPEPTIYTAPDQSIRSHGGALSITPYPTHRTQLTTTA